MTRLQKYLPILEFVNDDVDEIWIKNEEENEENEEDEENSEGTKIYFLGLGFSNDTPLYVGYLSDNIVHIQEIITLHTNNYDDIISHYPDYECLCSR